MSPSAELVLVNGSEFGSYFLQTKFILLVHVRRSLRLLCVHSREVMPCQLAVLSSKRVGNIPYYFPSIDWNEQWPICIEDPWLSHYCGLKSIATSRPLTPSNALHAIKTKAWLWHELLRSWRTKLFPLSGLLSELYFITQKWGVIITINFGSESEQLPLGSDKVEIWSQKQSSKFPIPWHWTWRFLTHQVRCPRP